MTLQNYFQNNAISDADKQVAAKSLSPQVDNSNSRVAFGNISTGANLISSRIASVRSGVSSGDETSKRSSWGQIFGSTANQGNTASGDGFTSKSAGMAIGYDKEITNDFILGVGASYSHSSINSRNSQNTNIDSYQLSLYSGYTAEQFFLNTVLGFGINQYNSRRSVAVVNNTAAAQYYGQSYSSRVELGQNYRMAENFIFTPTLAVTAANNRTNSYSENGAGNLNLQVGSGSVNFFEVRPGTEFSRTFTSKNGAKYRTHLGVSYGYDFAGDSQKATSSFVGQTTNFSSGGAKIVQGSWRLDTGVTFYDVKNVNVSANYTFDHRGRYNSNTGWLRLKYGF